MLSTMTYGKWYPPLLSEHGADVDRIIDVVHIFMALLFVAWGVFFVYCLFRYRQREGHKADYTLIRAKVSKYAEIGVVIFEVFILFALSVPVWADYKNAPPPANTKENPDNRCEIRVVAQQFQWNIHYPGKDGKFGRRLAALNDEATNPIGLDRDGDPAAADDVVGQELHLPVGRPVYIRMTSKDVIHSFSIPALRVKQDVIPGMEIPIWFTVKKEFTTEVLLQRMTETFPLSKVTWHRLRHHVAAKDHTASGELLLAAGADLGLTFDEGEKKLEEMRKAGIEEVVMHPRYPMELVCAQLCGNSHYTMTAKVLTHTPADFAAWMEEAGKPIDLGDDFDF